MLPMGIIFLCSSMFDFEPVKEYPSILCRLGLLDCYVYSFLEKTNS